MSEHYFEFGGDRTDVDSFHAAALLEREIQQFNVDGSSVTANLEHVYSAEGVAAPAVLSVVYGGGESEPIVEYLSKQEDVTNIEVYRHKVSIRCEVDAR